MAAPIKAATITKTFGNNMSPIWVLTLDKDAAEILGVTRIRYALSSQDAAERFAADAQSKLDDAYADACR